MIVIRESTRRRRGRRLTERVNVANMIGREKSDFVEMMPDGDKRAPAWKFSGSLDGVEISGWMVGLVTGEHICALDIGMDHLEGVVKDPEKLAAEVKRATDTEKLISKLQKSPYRLSLNDY